MLNRLLVSHSLSFVNSFFAEMVKRSVLPVKRLPNKKVPLLESNFSEVNQGIGVHL